MPTQALSPADPRSYLGFAKQAAKGTAVAPSFFAAYVDSVQANHQPNIRDVREAGGGQVIARQVKDFLAPSVTFAQPIRPDGAAALLAFFLGTAGVPTGAGPYTHTLTPNPEIVWLTFERSYADDVVERWIDAVVGDLTLDYRKRDQGPELMISGTAQAIAPVDQASTPTAESYETDRPFLRSDCAWTIDGNNPTNVESATINLQYQLDEAILADAVTRSSIVKLHLTASIQVVQLFDTADEADAYYRTHYWDGTAAGTTPGELVYPGDFEVVADYGAGAAQRQLGVNFPVVNWGDAVLSDLNPGASEAARITRTGVVVNNTGGEEVTITAINNRATDYLA